MITFRRFLSDSLVESKYVRSGANFGEAVSYLDLGECLNFESFLNVWGKWEEEYAHRGFRTISLDRFVEFGVWGSGIQEVLGKRREKDEKPIYYSQIYRENFLGKFAPILDLEKFIHDGKIRSGEYVLPFAEK